MYFDAIFAGFGGQGVLSAGDLLAFSYMQKGFEVSWFPSYGVEMRGGTANCTVVISSQKIGSPIAENPQAAVCFSLPALEKFQGRVQKDGVLVVNTSLVDPQKVNRHDLKIILVPVHQLVMKKIRKKQMANMVLLGALAAASKKLELDYILGAVADYFADKQNLDPLVRQSLLLGQEIVN